MVDIWSIKYRPKNVKALILPPKIKKFLLGIVESGTIPNMTFESSGSGTGKTSAALALVNEMDCDFRMINGAKGDERGISMVHQVIEPFAVSSGFKKGRKVMIIDEADNLTQDAQKALNKLIEDVAGNCSFIMTCNYINRLSPALQSRCNAVRFDDFTAAEVKTLKAQMLARTSKILEIENVAAEKDAIISVIDKKFPDYRNTLNELQKLALSGDITNMHVLAVVGDGLDDLVKIIKERDFVAMNVWVHESVDDPVRVILGLADNVREFFTDSDIIRALFVLNEFQVTHTQCVDPVVNLKTCLARLMTDLTFDG